MYFLRENSTIFSMKSNHGDKSNKESEKFLLAPLLGADMNKEAVKKPRPDNQETIFKITNGIRRSTPFVVALAGLAVLAGVAHELDNSNKAFEKILPAAAKLDEDPELRNNPHVQAIIEAINEAAEKSIGNKLRPIGTPKPKELSE